MSLIDPLSVFISYVRSESSDFVRELCGRLETHSSPFSYWTDELNPAGYSFRREIRDAVHASDAILVVATGGLTDSVWCSWEAALALERQIPVLVLQRGYVEPIPQLHEHVFIDFRDGLEQAWTQLFKELEKIGSPQALVDLYHRRLDHLDEVLPQAGGGTQARLRLEVRRLQERLGQQQRRLHQPEAAFREVVAGIRAERLRAGSAQTGPLTGVGLAHRPPPLPPNEFQDRVGERAELLALLTDSTVRLVALTGQPGIGKTALVTRCHDQLQDDAVPVPAAQLVYLSARGHRPIDPAAVLQTLTEVVADPVLAAQTRRFLDNGRRAWSEKVEKVLTALSGARVILVIDDADDLLDPDGALDATPLRDVVDDLLRRHRDHDVRILLVAIQPPRALLSRHRNLAEHYPLGQGLEVDDAHRFLCTLDPDGLLGLADLSTPQQNLLRRLTGGRPRALELIAGILLADPVLAPDTLLSKLTEELDHESERLTEASHDDQRVRQCGMPIRSRPSSVEPDALRVLLRWAMRTMDRSEQRVVQALAIYGRPVAPAAVDHLLQSYLPGTTSGPTLVQLHKRRLVRRDGGTYFVPRDPDRDEILGLLPFGEETDRTAQPPPLTRIALFQRASEYFAGSWGPVVGLRDLAPRYAEIELCLDGRNAVKALQLMDRLDTEYLSDWGQSATLSPWRKRLDELELPDEYFRIHNLSLLANAELQQCNPPAALLALDEALAIAYREKLHKTAVALWIQRGFALFDHGDVTAAEREFLQAEADAPGLGMWLEQARALRELARCELETARFDDALEHVQEALTLLENSRSSGAYGDNDHGREARVVEAHLHLYAAQAHAASGRRRDAVRLINLGRRLVDGDSRLQGLIGTFQGALATVRIDEGLVDEACRLADQAAETGTSKGNIALFREASCTLARGYLCAGEIEKANTAAASAARFFQDRRALGALALLGVTQFLGPPDQRERAEVTFRHAADHARRLAASEPDNYEVLEYEGLVQCGLALCDNREAMEESIVAYGRARDVTSEEQVVVRCTRLLRQLLVDADPAITDRVLQAAAGPFYDTV